MSISFLHYYFSSNLLANLVSSIIVVERKKVNLQMGRGKRPYLNSRTRPYYYRRCKKVRATNIDSLPDDLLFHILARVSADDIHHRTRFVCRRWCRIIHTHAFVYAHLHRTSYGLVLSDSPSTFSHPIFVTVTQGRIQTSELTYKRTAPILGSCNGLITRFKGYDRYILNPATTQAFLLPPFSQNGLRIIYPGVGVAYAPASMEYKVVITYRSDSKPELVRCVISTVGSADSSWRDVGMGNNLLDQSTPLITEGFMHWVSRRKVLTLNVETETVTDTSPPIPKHTRNLRYCYLSTGRYLSLLISCGEFVWEFWEMKPETGEWRRMADIELEAHKSRLQLLAAASKHYKILRPVGWVKYPEVLAFCFDTCIFYSLHTHQLHSIDLPLPCGHYSAVVHRNSLVWLG